MSEIQKIKELCIYKNFRYSHFFPINKRGELYKILSIVQEDEPLELDNLKLTCTDFCNYLKISEKSFITTVGNYNGQVEGICLKQNEYNKGIDLRYSSFDTFEDMSNFLDHIYSIIIINCLNTED